MSVQEFEQLRKKYARIILIMLAVFIIALVFSFGINGGDSPMPVIVWLFGLTAIFIVYIKLSKKYTKLYKEIFTKKVIEDTFDELSYEPDRGISRYDFESTGIFRSIDRYSSTDYVSGKYKGVHFEQAEIDAEIETQTTDSDGSSSTSYSPIFVGRWMIFDYNKSFRSSVKILERFFGDSFIYGLTSSVGYEKISLENPAFNKKFHTLSTSQHDAFYLLTPQMMETLLKLEAYEPGRIVFYFKDSRLQIGLGQHKSSFSPGFFAIFKKIDLEKIQEQIVGDIRVIMDFADSLRLENDLFMDAETLN